jgi:hypothetical protein
MSRERDLGGFILILYSPVQMGIIYTRGTSSSLGMLSRHSYPTCDTMKTPNNVNIPRPIIIYTVYACSTPQIHREGKLLSRRNGVHPHVHLLLDARCETSLYSRSITIHHRGLLSCRIVGHWVIVVLLEVGLAIGGEGRILGWVWASSRPVTAVGFVGGAGTALRGVVAAASTSSGRPEPLETGADRADEVRVGVVVIADGGECRHRACHESHTQFSDADSQVSKCFWIASMDAVTYVAQTKEPSFQLVSCR